MSHFRHIFYDFKGGVLKVFWVIFFEGSLNWIGKSLALSVKNMTYLRGKTETMKVLNKTMEIEFILKILVYYVDNGLCVTGNT